MELKKFQTHKSLKTEAKNMADTKEKYNFNVYFWGEKSLQYNCNLFLIQIYN